MPRPQTSLNQQRNRHIRALPVLVAVIGLLILVGWLITTGQNRPPTDNPLTQSQQPTPPSNSSNASHHPQLPGLIAATSDADWRTRAEAYEAINSIYPIASIPMRDTPIDQREAVILNWLDQTAPDLAHDLCEVYAQPDSLRFGRTLIQRCAVCHVGPTPPPALRPERCATCHQSIHDQWIGTAHANSTTHLHLITVNPLSRQQEPHTFPGQPGLSCTACHQPDATHTITDNTTATDQCVATFTPVACGTCHQQAQDEWQTWQAAPRYRRATWPPGSTERIDTPAKTCTDCHMPDAEHLWPARRDTDLLRAGIHVTLHKDAQGQTILTLHNQAGHAYPTGTTRRAIEIYIQQDDDPERLLTTLAHPSPTNNPASALNPDTAPALAPGEQRQLTLPGSPNQITVRLVYLRNRFQPGSYTTEITRVSRHFPSDQNVIESP